MNIFAIDLGNKRVKMKSDRAEYVYPASYLLAETVTKGVLGGWQLQGNQVYSIDKEGKFYKYAYIPAGYADYTGKEIYVDSGEGWYSPFYSFSELRKRAEKEMAGKSLSDADKNRYFISE